MLRDPKQLVGPGDGVEVGAEPVVEVSVRLPDLLQHLDVQAQVPAYDGIKKSFCTKLK